MQALEVATRAIRALETSLHEGFHLTEELALAACDDRVLDRGPEDEDLQIAAARRTLRVSHVRSRAYAGRSAHRIAFESPACSSWSQVLVFDGADRVVHVGWNFVPDWIDDRGRAEMDWSISDSVQARLGIDGFWQRLNIRGSAPRFHTYYVGPTRWKRWSAEQRSTRLSHLVELARDRERSRGYEGSISLELVCTAKHHEAPIMSTPSGETADRVHVRTIEPEGVVSLPDWTPA